MELILQLGGFEKVWKKDFGVVFALGEFYLSELY